MQKKNINNVLLRVRWEKKNRKIQVWNSMTATKQWQSSRLIEQFLLKWLHYSDKWLNNAFISFLLALLRKRTIVWVLLRCKKMDLSNCLDIHNKNSLIPCNVFLLYWFVYLLNIYSHFTPARSKRYFIAHLFVFKHPEDAVDWRWGSKKGESIRANLVH